MSSDDTSGGMVHVRGHSRGGPHGTVAVSDYDRSPPGGGGTADSDGRAWERHSNADFRDAIARAERSAEHRNRGYRQYNDTGGGKGALGRYQLRMGALVEAGWMDGLGRWTERAAAFGVKTDVDFLDRPDAQEAAMTDVLRDYDRQLSAKGLDKHIGKEYAGLDGSKVLVTRAGLIAAGHRDGMGATSDYLKRRVHGQAGSTELVRRRDKRIEKRVREFSDIPYSPAQAR